MNKYAIVYSFDDEHTYLDFCQTATEEQALVWVIKQLLCNGDEDCIKEFEEDENINLDEATLPELTAALDHCGGVYYVTNVATEKSVYEYNY